MKLDSIFEEQFFHFTSGLIAGGFVFFTLLSVTVVWFLKNPLLKLMLIFTALQTVMVSYDFKFYTFGGIKDFTIITLSLFTLLVQQFLHEINKNESKNSKKIKVGVIIIAVAMLCFWYLENMFFVKLAFLLQLLFWLFMGIQIQQSLKEARFFYRFSAFLIWFYSWMIFALKVINLQNHFQLIEKHFSQVLYLGWLGVSFFAVLSLIHQVVRLSSQNIQLEAEQLKLKNKLGIAQLESSENERKRIVSELHNDVLNRIDILTMTANQSTLDQPLINLNLTDSLNVLRKYTYKLYPPHTEVLSVADIFRREAELWLESSVRINVNFDDAWNQLKEDYRMPIFRFVEFVTQSIKKSELSLNGVWDFTLLEERFQLKIEFYGNFNGFTLNQDDCQIYKDLLSATSRQNADENLFEVCLIFNNQP